MKVIVLKVEIINTSTGIIHLCESQEQEIS